MVFVSPDSSPRAVITSATTVECSGLAGGAVGLDASASTDVDSTPGTNDNIVSFEWIRDPGRPGEQALGSGSVLNVTLPLGAHTIELSQRLEVHQNTRSKQPLLHARVKVCASGDHLRFRTEARERFNRRVNRSWPDELEFGNGHSEVLSPLSIVHCSCHGQLTDDVFLLTSGF